MVVCAAENNSNLDNRLSDCKAAPGFCIHVRKSLASNEFLMREKSDPCTVYSLKLFLCTVWKSSQQLHERGLWLTATLVYPAITEFMNFSLISSFICTHSWKITNIQLWMPFLAWQDLFPRSITVLRSSLENQWDVHCVRVKIDFYKCLCEGDYNADPPLVSESKRS